MVNNIKYYSQAGQDKWIIDLFKGKTNGFFIDIGAYDGIEISNTYALELLGWNGICVEANFNNFQKLITNRRHFSTNVAISNNNGSCFFDDNDKYGKISMTGRQMACKTIEQVLLDFNAPTVIDYLSLDIEGGEAAALSVFPFDKYTINAITVEHNAYNSGTQNKDQIYKILTANGFMRVEEVSADGLHFEDWYVNKNFII